MSDIRKPENHGGAMKCPRCERSGLAYEPWASRDLVAVCMHVRRCGFRLHIPNGVELNQDRRETYVSENWRRKA
jgi:hypothetical protein